MALSLPRLPVDFIGTTQFDAHDAARTFDRLIEFVGSFASLFYRKEQRVLSKLYVQGQLSELQRKSIEPIATFHHRPRRGLQRFIGAGKWEDAGVRSELHRQVDAEIGDPEDGVLCLDGSGFPKKGDHSVGVTRQWCGRLGKVDNCQVGVFIGYSGRGSFTLLDADVFLPHEWTRSRARLTDAHVPPEIGFRSKIQIADAQLRLVGPRIRHRWVVGDDEFGRPAWFRRALNRRGERYVLEVPSNTNIRDLEPASATSRRVFAATEWMQAQPSSAWNRVTVRHGTKGPKLVDVLVRRVHARHNQKFKMPELLIITRDVDDPSELRYFLSNADPLTSSEILARVASTRHQIEEGFELLKDDLGMDHYEVRSWVGWHHHMTLSLMTQWFVVLEHRRLGEKNHGLDDANHCSPASEPAA